MGSIVQFVLKHGYSSLFGVIFAHQVGLPIPGPLFLLATGALSADKKMNLVVVVALAVVAQILADLVWYEAARRRGDRVLHFIHRLASHDPDFHDRRAKATFARYGPPLLLIAKFVPGLDAVTPPLAGTSGTSRLRFVSLDAVGATLYAYTYSSLGYVFSRDLDRAAAYAVRTGRVFAGLAVFALAIYVTPRVLRWYRAVREARVAPITQVDPLWRA